MPIIKCKMCGGDIELTADKTFGTCEYCGSTMTLPKVSDDQRAAAFNRGNHFRRMGEFDKALGVYERIVAEDDTDAEAHWCCALSRFGIEYVEDPATYEWLPTCHRASFDSFLEDVDYLAAVEHSDGITRRQYQKDAVKISEVQRGILATSQNTEPYDVFISYKELDNNGERTHDSILAQEVYYRLTEKGWRVFFSRITLEDVPGTQYEPYIFAALNSAKVMIVVGTSAENLIAVWVKNEWSRFLSMMRKDKSKLLIPCYRDMDPYDLPEQLAVLMSYDMGKIGFIQDLIRGVDKVLSAEKKPEPVKETVVVQQGGGPNVTALLKRGQQALEDGEWDKAKEFYDQVLNMDAENAEAFFGLFLAGTKCADESVYISRAANQQGGAEKLSISPATERIRIAVKANIVPGFLNETEIRKLFDFDLGYPSTVAGQNAVSLQEKTRIETNRNLSRAFQYASGPVLERLDAFKAHLFSELDKRVEAAKAHDEATRRAKADAYEEHLAKGEVKAVELHEKANKRREEAEKELERQYINACNEQACAESIEKYYEVIEAFNRLRDYKDSKERTEQCHAAIQKLQEAMRLREKEEIQKKAEFVICALKESKSEKMQELEDSLKTAREHYETVRRGLRDFIDGDVKSGLLAKEIERINTERDKVKKEREKLGFFAWYEKQQLDKKLDSLDSHEKEFRSKIEAFQNNDYGFTSKEDAEQKCNLAAERVKELEAAIDERYQTVSGGIRIEDAKALLRDPSVLECIIRHNPCTILELDKGSTLPFGRYQQMSDGEPTPIEWIILKKEKKRILLLSKYALGPSQFSTEKTATWETSDLRKWLNSTFYSIAFTSKEQSIIYSFGVSNEASDAFRTNTGRKTNDKIFLLSTGEAKQFFPSDRERRCVPTAAAKKQGVQVSHSYGSCPWWLRSPGNTGATIYVDVDGTIVMQGRSVRERMCAVRPAMWIELSAY